MEDRLHSFEQLEVLVKSRKRQTVAVAAAQSEEVLLAAEHARQKGIIEGLLVGDMEKIRQICRSNHIDISNYELEDAADPKEAACKAVTAVRDGRAQLLMKGLVETGDFLKAVLNSENGIKGSKRLCSAAVLECSALSRLFVLADVGTNIMPDLEAKASILDSCFEVARALGRKEPKAAVLCAHEHVKEKAMPVTAEAALLSKMNERGQFGIQGIVEGPVSMDIAVSAHAAEIKNFRGRIRGDADILLTPDLEAGNILIKGLMYLTDNIRVAGVGMGAKVPLVLTSRGDDQDTKYFSIVLSSLVSQFKQQEWGGEG